MCGWSVVEVVAGCVVEIRIWIYSWDIDGMWLRYGWYIIRKRNSFGVNGGVDFVMVLYSEKVMKSGFFEFGVLGVFWVKKLWNLEMGILGGDLEKGGE